MGEHPHARNRLKNAPYSQQLDDLFTVVPSALVKPSGAIYSPRWG
jgi:hypothetical protein